MNKQNRLKYRLDAKRPIEAMVNNIVISKVLSRIAQRFMQIANHALIATNDDIYYRCPGAIGRK